MASSLSPLRVSVRPDFDALDVQTDGPARTKGGRPWVRWAKYGPYSGWYAVGARKPRLSGHPGFWEAVFSVTCACAGSNVDQAHCCGLGILALGGLGVTAQSGYAQLLLHYCLLNNPARYVEVMAPVLHETGVYTKPSSKSPSGVAFYYPTKLPALLEGSMESFLRGGSDGIEWSAAQKKLAQLWVSCCSELLRDEAMDPAQHAFVSTVMPPLLTSLTKSVLRWPTQGPTDWWQYTHEQQMLWALSLILASLENEEEATRLVCAAGAELENEQDNFGLTVLRRMQICVHDGSYQEAFRDLCVKATTLLGPLMQVAL